MQGEIEIRKMRGRKGWTSHEDQILRLLREDRGELKWTTIALLMQQQFSIVGKTGKQCRQRYQNHVKSSISTTSWTAQEDKEVLKLHDLYGNKWSIIAQHLPGRSQNCVKNHFYSKLRKVVRKLNRISTELTLESPSPVSKILLSKIVAVTESRFKPHQKICEQWVDFCISLIGRLYNFESRTFNKGSFISQEQKAEEILKDILYFQQNFKKKKMGRKDKCQMDYISRPFSSKNQENKKKSLRRTNNQKDHVQLVFNSQNEEKDNSQTVFLLPQGKSHEEQYVFLPDLEKLSENNVSRTRRLLQVGVDPIKQNMGSTIESLCELEQDQNCWHCRSKLHMLQSSEEWEYDDLPLQI